MAMISKEIYVGLMSGTSLDAVDGVVVDFGGKSGSCEVLGRASIAMPIDLKQKLHKFNSEQTTNLARLATLDRQLAELAAIVTGEAIKQAGLQPTQIKALAFAGQTIGHDPQADWTAQCGDPNRLAETTGITVVADFRRRDLAAGGQGAPLASRWHSDFLASSKEDRGIINLGGIANLTVLSRGMEPMGFDVGPANCLLDEWAASHNQAPSGYDEQGQWAAGGKVIDDLLTAFLGDEYFSKLPPKTTGRDYFNLAWLNYYLEGLDVPYQPQDVQATLVELTALSISLAVTASFNQLADDKLSLYVGGLAGDARSTVTNTDEDLRTAIYGSYVIANQTLGTDKVGGLVGHGGVTATSGNFLGISVASSYVAIAKLEASSGTVGGLVGDYNSNNPVSIKNSYVLFEFLVSDASSISPLIATSGSNPVPVNSYSDSYYRAARGCSTTAGDEAFPGSSTVAATPDGTKRFQYELQTPTASQLGLLSPWEFTDRCDPAMGGITTDIISPLGFTAALTNMATPNTFEHSPWNYGTVENAEEFPVLRCLDRTEEDYEEQRERIALIAGIVSDATTGCPSP